MTITPTFSLNHPQLGSLTGRLIDHQHADGQPVTDPVVHFRSIPYATIPARFSQSVLLDHIPDHFDDRPHRDFTQYGAACPQVPQPTGRGSATGGFVPGEEPIVYYEQACLNLTISTPTKNVLDETGSSLPNILLPVLVYVHGGGFIEGKGHVSALHDTTKMTELATHESTDVVIVSIGYRLNWQGITACSDVPLFNRVIIQSVTVVYSRRIRSQRFSSRCSFSLLTSIRSSGPSASSGTSHGY